MGGITLAFSDGSTQTLGRHEARELMLALWEFGSYDGSLDVANRINDALKVGSEGAVQLSARGEAAVRRTMDVPPAATDAVPSGPPLSGGSADNPGVSRPR